MVVTDTLQRLAYGAILTLAIGYILHVGRSILIPLVLGMFIAYLFWTMVAWVRTLPRVGAMMPTWLAHVGALALITMTIWALVILITRNIADVEQQMPVYRANLQVLLEQIAIRLNLEDVPTLGQVRDRAIAAMDVGTVIGGTVGFAAALLGNLFVVFIYTLFVLMERAALVSKLERLAETPEGGRRLAAALSDIGGRIGRYLALKTFVSALVGGGSWIIMRVIGIDFAEFWAVLIFILNFIPYIGSFIAVLLPAGLSLLQFGSFGTFLIALTTLTGIQMAVGNLLEPRLMGRSLNLSPVVILLSLAAWSSLWGVVGAFLCVPITVVMMIIFAQFRTTRPLAILLSQDGRVLPEDEERKAVEMTELEESAQLAASGNL